MRTLDFYTRIYTGECRILENRVVEQLVTTIQHRTGQERSLGIYNIWEPVKVENKEILFSKTPMSVNAIHFLPAENVSRVLYTGEYFVDENNFLSGFVIVYERRKPVKNTALLLSVNQPIQVEVL